MNLQNGRDHLHLMNFLVLMNLNSPIIGTVPSLDVPTALIKVIYLELIWHGMEWNNKSVNWEQWGEGGKY